MIANRPLAPNKDKRYPAEPLSPAEVSALIGACSRSAPTGIRNRAMLTLLYRSGLRINELLSLRLPDISFSRHSIRVLDSKTGQPQTRGFHPSADDALTRWIDTRRSLGLSHGPLFATLAGRQVSDDYVRVLLRRLAGRAGIEKRVHPHGLRHTFAVECQEAGMTVTEISKLLGHSSIVVTARYLDHLTNDQAVSALAAAGLPSMASAPAPAKRKRRADVQPASAEPAQTAPAAPPAATGMAMEVAASTAPLSEPEPDTVLASYAPDDEPEAEPEPLDYDFGAG